MSAGNRKNPYRQWPEPPARTAEKYYWTGLLFMFFVVALTMAGVSHLFLR